MCPFMLKQRLQTAPTQRSHIEIEQDTSFADLRLLAVVRRYSYHIGAKRPFSKPTNRPRYLEIVSIVFPG